MLFEKKKGVFSSEIIREGEDTILKINCEQLSYVPSIEDSAIVMSKTCDKLIESQNITKIIFSQKRDYEYDYTQTRMLIEIARLFNRLIKQKGMFSLQAIGADPVCVRYYTSKYAEVHNILLNLLKSDPLGAYVELKRLLRKERIELQKLVDEKHIECSKKYISMLTHLLSLLEKTKLIIIAGPYLSGYKLGERSVYRRIFSPSIKPDFMFTKLMASYPPEGEEIASFMIKDTEVTVFKFPDSIQTLYHVMPPEFRLSEDKYELLDLARKIMAEHKPKRSEFVDPQRMREVFYNVGHDLIEELANYRAVKLRNKDIDKLTKILVRYTVGFGLIEVLLQDEYMQDISVNSPLGRIPIFIVHGKFDDCVTNIIPTMPESESWASKLRMISGRPLDEANPILDTELMLPGAWTRVSAITAPLDPTGLAFSFRRHRDKPWTFPIFIKYKMINPLAAGLLSFLIDGTRTLLIAGTRSSGKTSFLGSMLVEVMRRYRMLTIEDTLELPTTSLRKLGYNIQPMKVASALAKGSSEMSASDGIRSTLRLGDSALIVGEVRSQEAKALYEAMRVGAAANVVAGTIHGDSPYGIYDRVVNDIGVPKTSFKATDIIVIANPVRSADGLHKWRRITQITEVRKHWEEDPLLEGGFMDLMTYDAKKDELIPSGDLINGDSDILKMIAGNIADFAGKWDAVWENILLRAKIKETLVNYSTKLKDDVMLEAPFVIKCNDQYHIAAERIKEETGSLDTKRIFAEWEDWLKSTIKKRKIK